MGSQFERPSGEQLELRHGAHRAVVTEVGAGLRVFDDVLLGFGEDEMCTSGRGQVLMPWPNRVGEGGEYEWEGRTHRLPVTDRANNSANHGLVRWTNWRCVERSESRVALEYVLHPQPGYPFTLQLRVEYALDDTGLTVTTSARNVGAGACPFGAGHHPYIACDVDALVGDEQLDECRRWDGSYELAGVTVWADERWPYVQLFTGDLPDIARRGFAVEPMTCPPQAFRTGEGLIRLEPGERFEGRWGIRP
jgi:aldose 1-epimerase